MKKTKSFRTKERQRAEGARLQSLVRADGHTRARADKHVDTRGMRQTLVDSACTTWRREGDGGGFSQSACWPERRVCAAKRNTAGSSAGRFLHYEPTDLMNRPTCGMSDCRNPNPSASCLGHATTLGGYVDASAARPSRSNLQHALMCPTRAARTLDCSQPSVRGRRVAQPRVQAVSRARRLRRAPLPTSLSRCDVTSMARKLIQRK